MKKIINVQILFDEDKNHSVAGCYIDLSRSLLVLLNTLRGYLLAQALLKGWIKI